MEVDAKVVVGVRGDGEVGGRGRLGGWVPGEGADVDFNLEGFGDAGGRMLGGRVGCGRAEGAEGFGGPREDEEAVGGHCCGVERVERTGADVFLGPLTEGFPLRRHCVDG